MHALSNEVQNRSFQVAERTKAAAKMMVKNEKRSTKVCNYAVFHNERLKIGVIFFLVALKLADMQLYSHSTFVGLVFAGDNVFVFNSGTDVKLGDLGSSRSIEVSECTHIGDGGMIR